LAGSRRVAVVLLSYGIRPNQRGRESTSEEQERGAGGGEEHGQLTLLVLDADLGADLVVDALEVVLVGGLEELAAGPARPPGESVSGSGGTRIVRMPP
jgi:hypothetical protein